jgi:hypothetical protein
VNEWPDGEPEVAAEEMHRKGHVVEEERVLDELLADIVP